MRKSRFLAARHARNEVSVTKREFLVVHIDISYNLEKKIASVGRTAKQAYVLEHV